MSVCKRPKNRRPCQTGNNIRVFINVEIVVVIDEVMPQRLPKTVQVIPAKATQIATTHQERSAMLFLYPLESQPKDCVDTPEGNLESGAVVPRQMEESTAPTDQTMF